MRNCYSWDGLQRDLNPIEQGSPSARSYSGCRERQRCLRLQTEPKRKEYLLLLEVLKSTKKLQLLVSKLHQYWNHATSRQDISLCHTSKRPRKAVKTDTVSPLITGRTEAAVLPLLHQRFVSTSAGVQRKMWPSTIQTHIDGDGHHIKLMHDRSKKAGKRDEAYQLE